MKTRPALLGFLTLAVAGCVSIPNEAPELSQALGQRLKALENANMTLLQRYFDLKRRDIDRFIAEKWVPQFAENVFSNPEVTAEWRRVVQNGSDAERLQFLVDAGPALQLQINEKRLELIAPLDELERRVGRSIKQSYDEAAAINHTLTSFLWSAAEVAQNRDRFLEATGVTADRVSGVIDGVDTAVSSLVAGAGEATEYLRKLEEIKTTIAGR